MPAERQTQIETLYHAALARPREAREAFLAEACGDDEPLRQEIESLLAHAVTNDSFLESRTAVSRPRLSAGQTLSHYTIVAPIGAGGMGEVYRARDTRLDREVAIKVLPASFIDDPDRLARFEREARLLASLNHPRIATIHGLERDGAQVFLVLELVAGPTLEERLMAGRLTIEGALRIGRQIAEALEAAHNRGIIHRDLKPSNVKIASLSSSFKLFNVELRDPGDGSIKLLDFGLAKTFTSEPTAGKPGDEVTSMGLIVGTPAYMSPEQARGEVVDRRTDIWAFGCVLYELLTGRRAFQGHTPSDTLAAILTREPDWAALPAHTPPAIQQLLRRCLNKDVAARVRDVSDARLEIEETVDSAFKTRRKWLRYVLMRPISWRWASLVALSLISLAGFLSWRAPESLTSDGARAVALASQLGAGNSPSLSPDGSYMAFSWTGETGKNSDVWVQQIRVGAPIWRTADPRDDLNPVWSPDNQWIGFLRMDELSVDRGRLLLIPPLGGPERDLADILLLARENQGLLAWCPDSSCLIAAHSPRKGYRALFVVAIDTGEKRQLTNPSPTMLGDSQPAVSPDGTSLVFRRTSLPDAPGQLYMVRLGSGVTQVGEPQPLTPSNMDARWPAWMPDGRSIIFSGQGRLWKLPLSGETGPVPLPFAGENGSMPTISRSQLGRPARLVYVRTISYSKSGEIVHRDGERHSYMVRGPWSDLMLVENIR